VSESCPICDSAFPDQAAARDHTWDAHGACHLCGDGFDGRGALYEHWLDIHESALDAESRKRAETSVGTRTVCPTCGDRFGNEDAVRSHSWDAHGACHHCGDAFDDETGLHAHWLSAHGERLQRSDRKRAEKTVAGLSVGERLRYLGPTGAAARTDISRRALLGGGGVATVALLGGAAATALSSGGSQSLSEHPAGASLSDQPTLGPDPGTADGTIIAFEDPSCPSCARFELTAFPKLQSRLIEPGRVSFVFRTLPVVAPWGEQASLALEAVQARDEGAFWGLKQFYYENQRSIGSDNVLDATRQHLAETPVDADGVVQDVRDRTHQGDIETNLRVAEQAGVRGTPTFYLFDAGGYVTQLTGPQSYSVFANSLGGVTMGPLGDVDLPTRRRDWRLIGRTTRLVLSIPRYALLALAYALLAVSVFVFARNLAVLQQVVLFGDLPIGARLSVLVGMYPGFGPAYTPAQTVLLVVTGGLIGVNLALVSYHLLEHRVSLRGGSGSIGGVVLGTLGAGCASCGSALLVGLLSLVGASGLLTALPLDGLEFALLAVGTLLLSIYWVASGLRGGTVRGCPVDLNDA